MFQRTRYLSERTTDSALHLPCGQRDIREGDGEEVINARPEGHAELVEVQGRSAVYASYRRVGELVGASEHSARYLVQTAISKIALEQFRRRRTRRGGR